MVDKKAYKFIFLHIQNKQSKHSTSMEPKQPRKGVSISQLSNPIPSISNPILILYTMASRAANLLVYKIQKRASKLREKKENKNSNRLCDLPDEILHHILSFLPIKSIAQTSVLSKRWNYLWTSFPILNFSEVGPFSISKNITYNEILEHQAKEMESILTTVLSRRHEKSNIKVFRVDGCLSCSCLDDCIRGVVKHRVEELVLKVGSLVGMFDLPLCVFECDSLRTLRLGDFTAKWGFPCSYVWDMSGLRSLHTLSLTGVEFLDTANSVVDLFSASSFPCLVNLTVEYCTGITRLRISCQNLRDVELCGMDINSLDISGMRLENLKVSSSFNDRNNGSWVNIFAPNLQIFAWENNAITEKCSIQSFPTLKLFSIQCRSTDNFSMKNIHSVVNLISGSSQVQNLIIYFDHLQILSKIYFNGGLPYSFMKLKILRIRTFGLKRCEIAGLACLFKSSPILHTLIIEMWNGYITTNDFQRWNNKMLDDADCTEEQYWQSQAQSLRPFLSHLKVVKISVSGNMIQENVITMARFLLEHGSALQNMILSSPNRSPPWKDKLGLFEGFSRASVDVKICFIF